jgi:hypothetical protein
MRCYIFVDKPGEESLLKLRCFKCQRMYSHALHKDVSVNNGPHIQQWSHKIIILYYNTYHFVTIAYSIQYGNVLLWGLDGVGSG